MSFRVFISHAHKDAGLARKVAKEVEKLGGQAFSGEWSLKQGDNFARIIQDALRNSDVVIAIVNKASAQSPWLNSEVGASVALGKRVAVITDDIEPRELPPTLRSLQLVDASQLDRDLGRLFKYLTSEKVAI